MKQRDRLYKGGKGAKDARRIKARQDDFDRVMMAPNGKTIYPGQYHRPGSAS